MRTTNAGHKIIALCNGSRETLTGVSTGVTWEFRETIRIAMDDGNRKRRREPVKRIVKGTEWPHELLTRRRIAIRGVKRKKRK